jgi:hypothetical protein
VVCVVLDVDCCDEVVCCGTGVEVAGADRCVTGVAVAIDAWTCARLLPPDDAWFACTTPNTVPKASRLAIAAPIFDLRFFLSSSISVPSNLCFHHGRRG